MLKVERVCLFPEPKLGAGSRGEVKALSPVLFLETLGATCKSAVQEQRALLA